MLRWRGCAWASPGMARAGRVEPHGDSDSVSRRRNRASRKVAMTAETPSAQGSSRPAGVPDRLHLDKRLDLPGVVHRDIVEPVGDVADGDPLDVLGGAFSEEL